LKEARIEIAMKMAGQANNHNVLKFDVVKWNMFIMVKLNVPMKINSVLSVQTNAILDFNWSGHASEFANRLVHGLVAQQNVPRSAVPQLNRNRTLAPLVHVPNSPKIMAEFALFSLTQDGNWLGPDRSNVKEVVDGQKFHQQLSW